MPEGRIPSLPAFASCMYALAGQVAEVAGRRAEPVQCSCSAGGAGGTYAEKWIDVDPGDEFVWDVGAAGAGGAAGNNAGSSGGDTTFGTFTCPGGSGGPSMAAGTTVIGTNGTAGPAAGK